MINNISIKNYLISKKNEVLAGKLIEEIIENAKKAADDGRCEFQLKLYKNKLGSLLGKLNEEFNIINLSDDIQLQKFQTKIISIIEEETGLEINSLDPLETSKGISGSVPLYLWKVGGW